MDIGAARASGWMAPFMLVWVGAFVCGSLGQGCKRGSKKEKEKKVEAKPEYLKPDLTGRYRYRVTLPPKSPCRSDADCMLTQLRPGDCCPDQCAYTCASRGWVLAVRRMHYPICVKFLKSHGYEAVCGRPPCKRLPGRPKASCQNGKCAVKYIPHVLPRPPVQPRPAVRSRPAVRPRAAARPR